MSRFPTVRLFLASLLMNSPLIGAELITPTSVAKNPDSSHTDEWPLGRLIDGSGLSGTPTIDNWNTITHSAATSGNAWVTVSQGGSGADYFATGPDSVGPIMTFQLDGIHHVSGMIIWGYWFHTTNGNEARSFYLEFSQDGGANFWSFGVSPQSVTPLGSGAAYLDFGRTYRANAIKLSIFDNHFGNGAGEAGGDRVGLGEIRFVEASVTNTNASGDGSLQAAINISGTGDRITFAQNLSGQTITLGGNALVLSQSWQDGLTIDASSLPGGITISGNNQSRVFETYSYQLTLNNLTITGGRAPAGGPGSGIGGDGGGIWGYGSDENTPILTMNRCKVTGNRAGNGAATLSGGYGSGGQGGGIWIKDGLVVLNECTISGNFAGDGAGDIDVDHPTVGAGGHGGGIALSSYAPGGGDAGARLVLDRCTVSGNTAGTGGSNRTSPAGMGGAAGGIYCGGNTELELVQSTLSGNQAGRGGAAQISGSNLGVGGSGGAVYQETNSIVSLDQSTIATNFAGAGGPSVNVPGNPVGLQGEGGGIRHVNGASISLDNSIVGGNFGRTGPDILATSTPTCTGKNLIGSTAGSGLSAGATVIVGAPQLGNLGNRGGPTQTMVPQTGSPAIDSALSTSHTTDQRGEPIPSGAAPDIGAVEYQGTSIVTSSADSGPGSLRDALALADPGATIIFDPSLDEATITLTSSRLVISNNLTVDASSLPNGITIDGNETYRGFDISSGWEATLKNLTVTRARTATGNAGAGLLVRDDAILNIERCTVSDCLTQYGAGAYVFGTLRVKDSTFSNNTATQIGGAIHTTGSGSNEGVLEVTNSTFSGNSAITAGAIENEDGSMALDHVTISGNSASSLAGGIYTYGSQAVSNSIVAGNTAPSSPDFYLGSGNTLTDTNNLWGPVDPLLAPLGDYGGPTQTHALMPGSPALDAAATPPGFDTDQRGFHRIRGAAPDIGAYESQDTPFSIGFNLVGGGPAGTSGTLGNTDVAGVFSQANWNNLTSDWDGSLDGTATNASTRRDSLGNDFADLLLWWDSPNVYGQPSAGLDTPDKRLMGGYIDSDGSGDGSSFSDLYGNPNSEAQPFFAVAGLPTAATRGGYRVIVYTDTDNATGRISAYWLSSNRGGDPSGVSGESVISPTFYTRDILNFSSTPTYVRSTATTDDGTSTPAANHVIFENLAEPGFIVRAEEGSLPASSQARAPISAVQVVRNEIIVVTTALDELDPPGTLGEGVSLREALRDAAPGSGIVFDPALDGTTLVLAHGELVIDKSLTIDASGLSGGVTVSGDQVSRVFQITEGNHVVITSLNIIEGSSGAGGGMINAGTLTLNQSTLSGNSAINGGGIFTSLGNLTLNRCTLSDNSASSWGGGIYSSDGSLTLNQSTLAGNSAGFDGGGIFSDFGSLTLNQSTLSGNSAGSSGGGIFNYDFLALSNCIVAGNTAAGAGEDILSFGFYVTNLGINLIGNPSGSGFLGSEGTDYLTGEPLLAPLGDYGGPTPTMPPLPDSPAIDAGTSADPGGTDQRGFARFINGALDIGAVEAGAILLVTTATDENDGGAGGTGLSLREAIAAAITPGDRIHFDPAVFDGGPGDTIGLTLGELSIIGKTLEIDGSAGGSTGVTVSGNDSSRVFLVNSGSTATIRNLTVTEGFVTGDGGGISAESAYLNLDACLVNECHATGAGGGVLNAYGTITVRNSTFSNNFAEGFGGGFLNAGGSASARVESCTFFGNTAPAASPGGISNLGVSMFLGNTIVAGNTGRDVGNSGTLISLGANLIGDNQTVDALFPEGSPNANGDYAGSAAGGGLIDPLLAPPGDYGGPTATMPPLPTSPAIDPSGGGTSSHFTTDQRGTGFARVIGGVVDIGAVESGNPIPGLRVDTSIDENDGLGTGGTSLRDAIGFAPAGSTIVFDPALDAATITLGGMQLVIARDLTVDASGLPNGLTVSGNNASRVFQVDAGVEARIQRLTIADGNVNNGAGILNYGGLVLTDSILRDNNSTGNGGGIYNLGDLQVSGCSFIDNSTDFVGGGIHNHGAPAVASIDNSTFTGNVADAQGGGGINNTVSATAHIHQCTLVDNHAPGASGTGGGIRQVSGTVTVENSIVSLNTASSNPDLAGTITQTGVNFIGGSPALAPLGNYGGPTPTRPPLPGSPVIEGASSTSWPTDQLGNPRPSGPLPDIGAVEALPLGALGLASTDGDSIPDVLEGPGSAYPHLDPGANDSGVDTDGDGSPDEEEIANMTSLFDPNDYFRILSFTKGAGFDPVTNPLFHVSLKTFPGLSYSFERLPGLGAPVPLGGPMTADGFTIDVEVTLEPGTDFVRAKRE